MPIAALTDVRRQRDNLVVLAVDMTQSPTCSTDADAFTAPP